MIYEDDDNQKANLKKLIPNAITITALGMGITAIFNAMSDHFYHAVMFVILAGVFDAMDGKVARLLNASSPIGAELDSLSDLVAFGVAPALILNLWSTHVLGQTGWIFPIFYIACAALRLAKFNIDSSVDIFHSRFFYGCPSPAAALLVLSPLMISRSYNVTKFLQNPYFISLALVLIGALMVSNIPMFSQKRITIRRLYIVPSLLCILIIIVKLISTPLSILPIFLYLYLLTIPYSIKAHRKALAQYKIDHPDDDQENTNLSNENESEKKNENKNENKNKK